VGTERPPGRRTAEKTDDFASSQLIGWHSTLNEPRGSAG